MENKFEPLSTGEVLSVSESTQILIGHSTFRVDELAEALRAQLLEQKVGGLTADKADWFTEEGIPCEALRFGADGWQTGKVRIHIEFCPSGAASKSSSSTKSQQSVMPTPTASVAEEESEAVLDDFGTIEVADDLLADVPDESLDETVIEEPADDLLVEEESLDETLIEDSADDLFGADEGAGDVEAIAEDDLFGGADEALDLGAEAEESAEDDLFGGADMEEPTAEASDDPWGETAEEELDLGVEMEEESMDDLFGGAEEELDFGTEEAESSEEEIDLGDFAQDEALDLGELEGSSEEKGDELFDDVWQDIN